MRSALYRLLLSTLLVVGAAFYTPSAMAKPAIPADPQCPSENDVQVWGQWAPTNGIVNGIRAPVELRTDGLLCLNEPGFLPAVTEYIGIENSAATRIAQIGFQHHFTSGGVVENCRFWATGTGTPTFYDCTGQTDHETVYFMIDTDVDQNYSIGDCGTDGDFDNCTQKSDSQAVFTSAFDLSSSEANYACTEQILGSNPDPVTFGNNNWGLVGQNGSGWVGKTWSAVGPDDSNGNAACTSDYKIGISSDIVQMWDSRETG